ncbi:HAD family hydrolase [Paracoccus alkanivorans]|uniref:HAD family hydrolase n=1 Tax=Paracoccus alkanivorans TaxID=2116655 RepID=A0A3M0MFM3_9RHOB|nr:HAD-IA family hydrolase [Paracoccus alkanivorans]RMC34390.1 HAD family hydrolase [Paracoccus alkanivorans]
MSNFRAILFDCDGVLIDSEPLACGALAAAITAAGCPMTQARATAIFSGSAAADSRDWLTKAGLDPERIFAEGDRILFEMFEREIPLIEGIEVVLRDFDVPMAVCSNSLRRRLELSIMRTALAACFGRHIWSADDVERPKPAPDMALHACRELGISPDQAIFIDDNTHGIRCACEAGCLAVGFVGPSDHRPNREYILRAAGADHVVHGMAEFHALLTRLSLPFAA